MKKNRITRFLACMSILAFFVAAKCDDSPQQNGAGSAAAANWNVGASLPTHYHQPSSLTVSFEPETSDVTPGVALADPQGVFALNFFYSEDRILQNIALGSGGILYDYALKDDQSLRIYSSEAEELSTFLKQKGLSPFSLYEIMAPFFEGSIRSYIGFSDGLSLGYSLLRSYLPLDPAAYPHASLFDVWLDESGQPSVVNHRDIRSLFNRNVLIEGVKDSISDTFYYSDTALKFIKKNKISQVSGAPTTSTSDDTQIGVGPSGEILRIINPRVVIDYVYLNSTRLHSIAITKMSNAIAATDWKTGTWEISYNPNGRVGQVVMKLSNTDELYRLTADYDYNEAGEILAIHATALSLANKTSRTFNQSFTYSSNRVSSVSAKDCVTASAAEADCSTYDMSVGYDSEGRVKLINVPVKGGHYVVTALYGGALPKAPQFDPFIDVPIVDCSKTKEEDYKFYCGYCGDKVCGLEETKYNCQEDCLNLSVDNIDYSVTIEPKGASSSQANVFLGWDVLQDVNELPITKYEIFVQNGNIPFSLVKDFSGDIKNNRILYSIKLQISGILPQVRQLYIYPRIGNASYKDGAVPVSMEFKQ